MSPGMLKAAAAGEVEFLIDQQQYLQGYLPIVIFAQYMRWGPLPAGVVMTGPGFVTPKNASKVIKWAAQGLDKKHFKRPGLKARPFFLGKKICQLSQKAFRISQEMKDYEKFQNLKFY